MMMWNKCINSDRKCECARIWCVYGYTEVIDLDHNPEEKWN